MYRKEKAGLEPIFDEKSNGFERLIMLCDGIFAIAMTLLILDIKLPAEAQNASTFVEELGELLIKSLYYLLTFITLALFWMGHRRLMTYVKRQDGRFTALTFVFLAFVIFFPVSLNVLEGNAQYPQAVILYTLILAGCGISSFVLWIYASWKHRLIDPEISQHEITTRSLGILITPVYFCLTLFLLFIPDFNPYFIFFTWALLPLVGRAVRVSRDGIERRMTSHQHASISPAGNTLESTPAVEAGSPSSIIEEIA